MTDVIEKAAEAHYTEYFAGVQDLEPKWIDLPDDARARFIEAMQAAYTAIVGDKVLVDRPDPSPFASSGERSALAHIEINPDTPPPDWVRVHLKRLRTMGFINENMTEATKKGRKALMKRFGLNASEGG